MWRMLAGLVPAVVALCLALLSHTHAVDDSHTHWTSAGPVLLVTLIVGLGLVAAAITRRRQLALVLALVPLLTLLTVETALHSVHHLGDPQAEASCVVAGASTHLGGVTIAPVDLGQPVASPERHSDRGPAWPVPFQPVRPREGRAPPAPVLG
jgi:hypothetical protein